MSIIWARYAPYSRPQQSIFDPNANLSRLNRNMVYLDTCLIVGIRLACEKKVNVRVIPTIHAIEESVDLAHKVYTRVFKRVPHE